MPNARDVTLNTGAACLRLNSRCAPAPHRLCLSQISSASEQERWTKIAAGARVAVGFKDGNDAPDFGPLYGPRLIATLPRDKQFLASGNASSDT